MLDVQPPPGTENLMQQFAQEFTSGVTLLLATVDSTVIDVSRVAYVPLVMVGLLLYYTPVERRLEKDLIKGGVALAVLSEYVLPMLTRF
ncbi:MAG TPA: hypothetical protein VLY82_02660 [Nitrososphaerales archaeon]|nr:hypothetical protein [Nitrososphaerales archaeon]